MWIYNYAEVIVHEHMIMLDHGKGQETYYTDYEQVAVIHLIITGYIVDDVLTWKS